MAQIQSLFKEINLLLLDGGTLHLDRHSEICKYKFESIYEMFLDLLTVCKNIEDELITEDIKKLSTFMGIDLPSCFIYTITNIKATEKEFGFDLNDTLNDLMYKNPESISVSKRKIMDSLFGCNEFDFHYDHYGMMYTISFVIAESSLLLDKSNSDNFEDIIKLIRIEYMRLLIETLSQYEQNLSEKVDLVLESKDYLHDTIEKLNNVE